MNCGVCATKVFFIDKTYSFDDYEMTNVFNMLDDLFTNMISAVMKI